MEKRDFIKLSGLIAGDLLLGVTIPGGKGEDLKKIKGSSGVSRLKFSFSPYTLQMRHAFTLSTSTRTTTPVMLTELEFDGITGYGEASMPPYLGESHETAARFLSQLNMSQFSDPFLVEDILAYVDDLMPGNYAAKASVDIALHDLLGKLTGMPLYQLFGLDPGKTPDTSFTIGMDEPDMIRQKTEEADRYNILKVKLGKDTDKEMIEVIRTCTDKPLCADVNQGWKSREHALEMAFWLKEKGVVFLEQPLPRDQTEDLAWLTSRSPIPIIGDEAIQNLNDMVRYRDIYSGINIKLMKCGGLRAAYCMMKAARALGMKVMIGCMTETSCAVTAAAHLSPLADWCDLDGNLLISNDLFDGITIVNGRVTLPAGPGIGIEKKKS